MLYPSNIFLAFEAFNLISSAADLSGLILKSFMVLNFFRPSPDKPERIKIEGGKDRGALRLRSGLTAYRIASLEERPGGLEVKKER